MHVFFLYELSQAEWETKELLLRVTKEVVSSSNSRGEDLAEICMERKRDALLRQVLADNSFSRYRLLGSFELSPEGDELYEEKGGFELALWYAQTAYGSPYIVLSQAETEEDFYHLLETDEDMYALNPIYPAERVQALFHTENDFPLPAEQIAKAADKELELLYDSEEDCEYYMKKRFQQVFLEAGWSFEQVYEILDTQKPEVMTAQYRYRIREDRPMITVGYDPLRKILSVSLSAHRWAASHTERELGFACGSESELARIMKNILYYKDCFDYDADYQICGYEAGYRVFSYEEMMQKLSAKHENNGGSPR